MNKIDINLKKVPLIMGILNVTPDSFYDGGRYTTVDRAISHVEQMVKDGADIIDVGGESTRPGSSEVTIQQEMDRVCPVVERISHEFNIPISIDTQKSKVAEEVLKSGASIVNDISGLRHDN
ncbi:MAG TPA: dihydropteroate synthase, partial [Spirochaetota bacterium]|nr:dihydropteroate synthase [Spirochaetota bacterium]